MKSCVRITLTTLVLLASSLTTLAQPDDPLAQYCDKRTYNCPELTRMVTIHLPRLVAEDKPDSARFLLDSWVNGCPTSSIPMRTMILMDIWEGKFRERDYDEHISDLALNFEYYNRGGKTRFLGLGPCLWGEAWEDLDGDVAVLDGFLKKFARKLNRETSPGTMEHLLAGYFGLEVDNFFKAVMEPEYEKTRISRSVAREVDSLIRPRYLFLGVQAGVWAPTGDLKRTDPRALMAFVVGYRWDRWQARFNSYFAQESLDDEVLVSHEGQLQQAGTFAPISGGIDLVRTVVDHRRMRLDLLGGANYTAAR